jgi:PAS domain S-box-containing protein
MGIRKRAFFLLVFAFVPLLFLQGFTFYKWYGESKEAEMQANLELARTVSKTFDAFINDVLHTQLAIGLAATASPPPSDDSLRRILLAAEETNPMLRSFTWSSPAGVNLVTTNTAVNNPKIRAEALVPRIVSGEEYGVSDLHVSPNTGEKVFVIGRGIREPKGNLLGIISCVCVPDKLDPLLAVQRSKDTAISLLDSKGIHVYRFPTMEYTPVGMNRLKRQPLIQNALEGKEAAAEVHGPRDEIRLAAFVPIPSIGWVAASSRAEHEVIESITQTLLPYAVLMLLVTLAAFGAAIILSRPISTSIRRLQDHAAALGKGEVERFQMVLGPREIKSLSLAFNDMAEKIRSREQALRKSEQKYRAIVENMSDVVFIVDQTGKLLFITPSATRLIGYEQSEMIGHNIQEFIYKEDFTAALKNIGHAVSEKGIISNEIRLLHKNGSVLWMQTFTRPLFEEGDAVAVQGSFWDITERKQAEEALKASERKFRDLITNMQEVLYTLDRNGRITFVSPSVLSMTQYRDSDIIGHHVEEFIFSDDLPRLLQELQNFLSGKGKSENEYRMVTKSGEIRWMRTLSSLLFEGEEIIGVQGILSDITERKKSEEEVRATRDMLQLIMNNIPQGIFWKDRRSTYLGCNNVLARAVGLESAVSIIGKTDYDLPWSTEQAESFREYDRRIMENDRPEYRIIEQQREADGKLAWVETNKVPLHDAQGNVIGIMGTYEDITERKRVEEALRESEEKFRSLVETTSDWIWETDADGVYTYTSPRVRSLLGYEPEEVLGRKPFEFMPPDESARIWSEFARMAKERKAFVGLENVNIRKDGRRVVLETSGVPRLDGQGNLLGYRGIDRDITDRKRAEEVLKRSHHELEFLVQERTAELERRNEELQNFTFAAAHDLQEPLRKIQTFSDLLDTNSINTKDRDYIKRMHETATRMRQVLQSLMKYSSLTSKAEPFGRIDLNEVAREVVSDLELQIRDTGALVEIRDLPEIEADAGQMRQLFQNLLENAMKFRREGIQPIIRIHADSSSQSRECHLTFNDNGIGFEEKYMERIFKPFYRLHGKDEYAGVGMGLSICSKVIEHHRGTITAKSTPGKGSTFIITLPVKQGER